MRSIQPFFGNGGDWGPTLLFIPYRPRVIYASLSSTYASFAL